MTVTEVMLRTYPKSLGNVDERALARCIDACVECAQACTCLLYTSDAADE